MRLHGFEYGIKSEDNNQKLNDYVQRQRPEAQSINGKTRLRQKMSWKQVVAQNGPKAGNLTPLYGDSGLRIVDGSVLGGSTACGAR